MTLWQSFLKTEISHLYELSRQETKIILAKFPDEKTTRTNNEVADRLTENSEVAIVPENVRRQMWTIYNERFCPTENREGFPDYYQHASPSKDTAFLNWLKHKYSEWLTTQNSAPPANAVIIEEPSCDILLNPFIPQNGRVDNPQQFFNRNSEIQRVFELLNSNSSVALIGEEGMGKSSLLLEICRQSGNRLSSPRQPVYLDLNEIHNEDDFYSDLCEKVGIPESKGNNLTRALQQHRHRLLLAIDNVGNMAWEGFTRNVRDQLRGLAEGSNATLRLILAAGKPLDQLFQDSQDESQTSPLAGIFLEEHIKLWDEETARAFIESRLETTSVRFTQEEITQLVQESAGHPRRLMQLSLAAFDNAKERAAIPNLQLPAFPEPPLRRQSIWETTKPVPNPYVVGDPVEGKLFVGREDVLRKLEELWVSSYQVQSVVLFGHRRMGKTSILKNVANRLGSRVKVAYINLLNLGDISHGVGEVLMAISDEISRTVNLPPPADADLLNLPSRTFERYLKQVEANLTVRLIIALDEFEKIEELIEAGKISKDFTGVLRGMVQMSPRIAFAFAGLHTLEEMTADYFQPYFASVIPIKVGFMEPAAIGHLLANPDEDFPLDYKPEALDLIYELTAGQPYLVQLIGFGLVRRYNDQVFKIGHPREPVFTVDDVETVINDPEFFNWVRYYFIGVWGQAAQGAVHQEAILKALAPHPEGLSLEALAETVGVDETTLGEALKTLTRHDVVEEKESRWRIIVELFRRWVLDYV